MRDRAQLGETVGRFIEAKALEGGNQHYAHLQQQQAAQAIEEQLFALCFAAGDHAHQVKQAQADQRHGHQLKEAAPGILGVGEAFDGDVGLAGKEVLELHDQEGRKKQVNTAQDHQAFYPA